MLGFRPLSSGPISSIGLGLSLSLIAAQGTFALSAPTTTLRVGRVVGAAQGTFSLSAPTTNLTIARKVVAAQGVFTLAGQPAALYAARKFTAAQGTFALGGLPVNFPIAKAPLAAGQGIYTLAGQSTAFGHGFAFSTAKGTFTLTGTATGLKAAHIVTAGQGTFGLAGNPATLTAAHKVVAGTGTYTLVGQPTAFDHGYEFVAGSTSYALTGTAAAFKVGHTLPAAKGIYTLVGKSADVRKGKTLYANQGVYALSFPTTALILQESAVGKSGTNPFPSPVNNQNILDANIVRNNDNLIANALTNHDANTAIHVQSGTLAYRPASLTNGGLYVATDTQDTYFYTNQWLQVGWAHWSGAWQSFATQTLSAANTATLMTINQTDVEQGVVLVPATNSFKTNYAGTYNLQWSGQFNNTSTALQDLYVWIRKNGVDVPGSAGVISVPNSHGGVDGHVVVGWNYFLQMNAGDTLQMYWAATNTSVSLISYAAPSFAPSTASLIVTVNRV